MKKFLPVFFGLLQGMLPAQPNTDYPIQKSGIWVQQKQTGGVDDPLIKTYYMYVSSGDTLLTGQVYNKLYKQALNFNHIELYADAPYQSLFYDPAGPLTYTGAYRNDTTAKKTYLVLRDSLSEKLWYDFDLHIGDTLPDMYALCMECDSGFMAIVQGIDISEGPHHYTFQLQTADGLYLKDLKETEGFTGELLHENFPYFEMDYQVQVFCHDSLTYNFCYNYVSGLAELPEQPKQIKIYPNPGNGQFFVESQQCSSYEILSARGKTVASGSISSNKTFLSLEDLPNGVYFIRLKDAHQHIVAGNKLVINH